jgi:4'-phosphopantetheinyl transferase EntD
VLLNEPEPFSTAFELSLPHGALVAVVLPEAGNTTAWAGLSMLHPQEREAAEALQPLRSVTWVGGRIAIRRALVSIGAEAVPILSTARGAPLLPEGVIGSISHKNRLAAAIVAKGHSGTVGLDLEQVAPARPKIARLVLTPEECCSVDAMPESTRWPSIITRFSVKESIFKALDPYVHRYIGFHEASVVLHDDGTTTISLSLKHAEGPFVVDGQWLWRGDWIVTTVRAHLASTTMLSTFQ